MPSTIVSAMPMKIHEQKIGIIPAEYTIPAATDEESIRTLVIKDAEYAMYTGGEQNEWIHLPIRSFPLAQAICNDYCSALPEVGRDQRPAVFPLNGEFTVEEVTEFHGEQYDEAMEKHVRWFKRLVAVADDEWQKFRQHRMINDLQRLAVDYLGLERDWRNAITPSELMRCPACASVCMSDVAVCANCRCIMDAEKYKTLQFAHEVPVGSAS